MRTIDTEGMGKGGEGKVTGREGGEQVEGGIWPTQIFWHGPPMSGRVICETGYMMEKWDPAAGNCRQDKMTINLIQKFRTLFKAVKTPRLRRRRHRGRRGMGRGFPLPIQLGDLGQHRKLPQQSSGWSPGRKWIWCILSSTERISDRQTKKTPK